jgi:hypothetical protein
VTFCLGWFYGTKVCDIPRQAIPILGLSPAQNKHSNENYGSVQLGIFLVAEVGAMLSMGHWEFFVAAVALAERE